VKDQICGQSIGAQTKGAGMPNNDPYPSTSTYTGGTTAGNPPGPTTPGSIDQTTESVRERVSQYTHDAREKANEFGRKSAETIDRNLDAAAGKLQNTAESLRMKAGAGEDRMSRMAGNAADKLDATARYFREHHTHDMVSGVEQVVRRNPGASICAALALGFLLGSALKRDRYPR
jgi:ElaB/YqjD/DUF883 family membrane-anchored ribosome-binding protein